MGRFAVWLLPALILCGVTFVGVTTGTLPPRVATHFASGGMANGWMPRDGYLWFALVLQLLPLGLFLGIGWLPVRFDRFTNLPHRDYWLAPARREATAAWLRGMGASLACAMALLLIGLHAAILDANARMPPRLDEPLFIAGLVTFVAVVIAGVIAMHVKFRNVPRHR
jgi:hypothetical protein